MTIIPLLVACSLFLALCGVLLFVYSARNHDHEHADRLALLPLEDDLPPRGAGGAGGAGGAAEEAGGRPEAGEPTHMTPNPDHPVNQEHAQ